MKKFFDDRHAENRLSRCYIGYKTDGVWNVARCDSANQRKVQLNNGLVLYLQSPNVKVVVEELGYVNTKHQCFYTTRKSRRMWKAGLVPENLKKDYLYPEYATMGDEKQWEHALAYILNDKYPDFKSCLRMVETGLAAARAFSNRWAVGLHDKSEGICLFYRNEVIGYIEDGEAVVGDVYKPLEEQYMEHTGKRFIS